MSFVPSSSASLGRNKLGGSHPTAAVVPIAAISLRCRPPVLAGKCHITRSSGKSAVRSVGDGSGLTTIKPGPPKRRCFSVQADGRCRRRCAIAAGRHEGPLFETPSGPSQCCDDLPLRWIYGARWSPRSHSRRLPARAGQPGDDLAGVLVRREDGIEHARHSAIVDDQCATLQQPHSVDLESRQP